MNTKALIIAIGAAALGLVLLLLYKQRFEAEASGGVPVRVLIAVQDIPLGAALSENMMGYRLIPQAYLEDRFIRYSDVRRIIGVRVSNGLRANQTVMWTDLATASDARRDLSSLVSTGMRAITVRADITNSFGGLLRPGDRVDVLGTLSRTGGENDRVTIPLLQNVLVLAAGRDTGGEAQRQTVNGTAGGNTPVEISQITLSVSMEEAQLLTYAADRGGAGGRHTGLTLVLRNPEDIAILEGVPETNIEDIFEPTRRANVSRRRRQVIERIGPQNPNAL
ncbi:MAG: Flp pilus assembly protein CpaB [Deltaproteobacteria bacterium]|nr:Flp pilus assembly protein CpaB [Deltaproteobacteria bacterium]MBK8697029.1 Flp pilus assembly protein CpaB [Deltaproteobacteria bacterium]MBP6832431.1 Flp pilus assembly protein CpaB [Deltaproteobacteria bacterium]TAK21678.1 MAG: Flp pilus assembly protein CpaB [Myxococcaceae bacterium]